MKACALHRRGKWIAVGIEGEIGTMSSNLYTLLGKVITLTNPVLVPYNVTRTYRLATLPSFPLVESLYSVPPRSYYEDEKVLLRRRILLGFPFFVGYSSKAETWVKSDIAEREKEQ